MLNDLFNLMILMVNIKITGVKWLKPPKFGIDIDHAENGVYLPSFSKNTPMNGMKNASPHSKTHTNMYYLNVEYLLDQTIAANLGREGIIETLEDIAEDLQKGDFPLQTRVM